MRSVEVIGNVQTNQAELMPMFSQIKPHLTKNPALSKFGPDIGNDFVQQPNFGHKYPVSGITKSFCVFRDKIVHPGGEVPPTTPQI